MIVIYTPRVTNRIKYTLDFVFTQYFGIEYTVTENPFVTDNNDFLFLNYSNQFIKNSFSIFQDSLLLEDTILEQKIIVSREKTIPVFFQTLENTYQIKFDIFSCIFYLLSRYEEYLPHEKDIYGRYKSSNSILANAVFLFGPIVEIWLDFLKQELLFFLPTLNFKKQQFQYIPTFDIDNAFQYLGRNWKKNPPNIFNSSSLNVLFKKKKDSFDTFDFIVEEINRNNLIPVFFFLLNDDKPYNSIVSPKSKKLAQKISKIKNNNFPIAIHPSFAATENNILDNEKQQLEIIIQQPVYYARQHFLRIGFPHYFRLLLYSNIQQDFSLSYPDVIGFRAGCSKPFYFFDVDKNEVTSLLLQPSCWMDATFEYYITKNLEDIKQDFLYLLNQLKKINGNLVPIFHNDLLSQETYKNIFLFMNQNIKKPNEKQPI